MKKLTLPMEHWNQLRMETQFEWSMGEQTKANFAIICRRRYEELYNHYPKEK